MKKHLPKGILLSILAIALLFGIAPYLSTSTEAYADTTHTHDGITFTEWTDELAERQNPGKTAANSLPAADGSYYLTGDVTLDTCWKVFGDINLCLDGKSITYRGGVDPVIDINGGTLTLYDKEDNNGNITGGKYSGVLVNGTFNMHGGTITGNSAHDGGGVNMLDGFFNMYGGKISENHAVSGGGVQVQGYNEFTMSGGCITNNEAYDEDCSENGFGGGVCVDSKGTMNMSGTASVTGNKAAVSGGGVYVQGGDSSLSYAAGKLNISGSAAIHGNTDTATTPVASNVFLSDCTGSTSDSAYYAKITIAGELTGSVPIGITMEEAGVFTSGLSKGGYDAIKMFASDKADYVVVKDGNEAKLQKKVATPTFDPVGGTYTSAQNVTISCNTDDATIHYTTDGSNPTTSSDTYSGPINVSSTSTIKAIAVKTGMTNSEIASAKYEFDVDPHGSLEVVEGKEGSILVAGWAFDPSDTTQQIDVHVYIGGEAGSTEAGDPVIIKANTERPDVDALYHCGDHHGFGETITTSKRGEQDVYVYAVNIGDGKNICLGNKTVKITEPETPIEYQLQYDPGDGGSGSMTPETVKIGDNVILPNCTFIAPLGKKFYKWQISGVDGIFDPGYEYTVVENSIVGNVITVTATWKEAPSATVTTEPTANSMTYTGASQELVTAGMAADGTMGYALGADSTTAPTSGWSASIPTGIEVGTYYVWYKAVGDASHSDTAPKCVVAEISKSITEVTVNVATVNAKAINKAIEKAGTTKAEVETIVLGKKVKKISKGAFKNYKKTKTLVVKTKKLKKSKVKNSLKGSKVTQVKVQVGSKKVNKKYVKKYKKIFTKKNAGKKVKVTL